MEIHLPHSYLPFGCSFGKCCTKTKAVKTQTKRCKSATELDENLRKMDKEDPVKYDFALFGLGVFENFKLEKSKLSFCNFVNRKESESIT